ncbi:MAG TPA: hypothetical protein VK640_00500, partial [Actinomycetes bacterium]|nr:hypothetical protein [Actinomycetes bacterium]
EQIAEPVVVVTERVVETVTPVVGVVAEPVVVAVGPVVEQVAAVTEPVVEAVTPVVEQVVEQVAGPVAAVTEPVVQTVTPVVEQVTEPVLAVVEPVVEVAQPVVEVIEQIAEPVVAVTGPVVEAVTPVIEQATESVVPVIEPVVDGIAGVAAPEVGGLVAPVVQVTLSVVDGAYSPLGAVAPVVGLLSPVVAPVVDAVAPDVVGTPVVQSVVTVLSAAPDIAAAGALPPLPTDPALHVAEPSPSPVGSVVALPIGPDSGLQSAGDDWALRASPSPSTVVGAASGSTPIDPLPLVPSPFLPSPSTVSSAGGSLTAPKAILSAAVPELGAGRIPLDVTASDSVGGASCVPGCSPD